METLNDTKTQHADQALAAFNKMLAKINAVPESSLRPVNVDVPIAITTVLGAQATFMPFMDAAKKLEGFDASCFTDIADLGLALREAHGRFLSAGARPDIIQALVDKATDVRDLLLIHVQALAKSGLVEPSRVADIARGLGHRGVAFDIRRLLPVYRDNWDKIQSKTPITLEMLDEYGGLSDQLIDDVADQQRQATAATPASLTRQRAYTLFFNAYDQIRRAITFIRWSQDDVDHFAPSLFAGRGGRPAVPPVVTPAQPAPAQPAPAQPEQASVAQGLPGAPAFTR